MFINHKPHFKKVKCIVYWYPEDIEGHLPTPGWQVTPYRHADDDNVYGLGTTVQEAWEDYLGTLHANPISDSKHQ